MVGQNSDFFNLQSKEDYRKSTLNLTLCLQGDSQLLIPTPICAQVCPLRRRGPRTGKKHFQPTSLKVALILKTQAELIPKQPIGMIFWPYGSGSTGRRIFAPWRLDARAERELILCQSQPIFTVLLISLPIFSAFIPLGLSDCYRISAFIVLKIFLTHTRKTSLQI